jgi:hypothetical protein
MFFLFCFGLGVGSNGSFFYPCLFIFISVLDSASFLDLGFAIMGFGFGLLLSMFPKTSS